MFLILSQIEFVIDVFDQALNDRAEAELPLSNPHVQNNIEQNKD
tara:strand:+ start:2522 stop:2653 length:132 start_codon:yes stop_codon:yes gene_type:complete